MFNLLFVLFCIALFGIVIGPLLYYSLKKNYPLFNLIPKIIIICLLLYHASIPQSGTYSSLLRYDDEFSELLVFILSLTTIYEVGFKSLASLPFYLIALVLNPFKELLYLSHSEVPILYFAVAITFFLVTIYLIKVYDRTKGIISTHGFSLSKIVNKNEENADTSTSLKTLNYKYCPFCGNKFEDTYVFCSYCGKPLQFNNGLSLNNSEKHSESGIKNKNGFQLPTFDSINKGIGNIRKSNSISKEIEGKAESINISQKQFDEFTNATYSPIFSSKGLFSLAGRRGRAHYFIVNIFYTIISTIISSSHLQGAIFLSLIYTGLRFPNITKRMHDLNHPTKWAGVYSVYSLIVGILLNVTVFMYEKSPFKPSKGETVFFFVIIAITVITEIYLQFFKGTIGPNIYGPDPLQKGKDEK